jgi:hypothetical protein
VLTLDLQILGQRHKDIKNGLSAPPKLTSANILNLMTKPRWCLGMLGTPRRQFGNIVGHVKGVENMGSLSEWTAKQFDPRLNWADVEWIKQRWGGKLILKGIQDVEDARLAADSGADALIVSNHGGRQLDGAPSSISALPRSSRRWATASRCTWTAASAPASTCSRRWRWAPRAPTSAAPCCTGWARWGRKAWRRRCRSSATSSTSRWRSAAAPTSARSTSPSCCRAPTARHPAFGPRRAAYWRKAPCRGDARSGEVITTGTARRATMAAVTCRLRRIAHLDMDAFFASVELLRYPQLKGLPIVIGGGRRRVDEMVRARYADRPLSEIPPEAFPLLKDYTGRGVITTATYPARQFGVGSAMGMMKAAKLCPQAIVLPVDFDEVRRYSRTFKAVIRDIAPVVEDRGIDEVYIDFTEVPGGQREGGRVLARLIQKSILEATGLTCSIGVAPNKLIAKMASEFDKPNGISIVHEDDVQDASGRWRCARSTASARRRKPSCTACTCSPSASWPRRIPSG